MILNSLTLAENVVGYLEDKKANEIELIDIKNISTLADYFIICSGTSTTHIRALADDIEEKLSESGLNLLHKEGYNTSRWILLDYGEVVAHIFHQEDRNFYNLERLWSDGSIYQRKQRGT